MVSHIQYLVAYKLSQKCDFYTQIKLKQCNRYLAKIVKIEYIPQDEAMRITNGKLKSLLNSEGLSDIKTLDLSRNYLLTDEGLKNLSNLTEKKSKQPYIY